MTKSRPRASRPERCQAITSLVMGRNRRFGQSAHLIRGFSQRPRTHSLAQASAYPALPVLRLSKRRGKKTALPREKERKNTIFSSGGGIPVSRAPVGVEAGGFPTPHSPKPCPKE